MGKNYSRITLDNLSFYADGRFTAMKGIVLYGKTDL